MSTLPITTTFDFEQTLQNERARLVRLCSYFSGDSNAAEDLAQETLLEAWRHADRLHDPSGCAAWLSAIARNVCLRHQRKTHRDLSLTVPDFPADETLDLAFDLERGELATLLDRALSLLPSETRAVLIAKYLEDTPLTEIAHRLDAKQGTVAVRLHRGKLELKRLLETELRADAAAFGLLPAAPDEWTSTRVWCPACGDHHLEMRVDVERADFAFRCPHCNPEPNSWFAQATHFEPVTSVKTAKPLLNRFAIWMENYVGTAMRDGTTPCYRCGSPTVLTLSLPSYVPQRDAMRGVSLRCTRCSAQSCGTLDGLALNLPLARDFWRQHPRIRTLPEAELTFENQPAVRETFEALDTPVHLHVLYHAATYQILSTFISNA